jgi:glutathione S-transferase
VPQSQRKSGLEEVDEETRKQRAELKELVDKAKEQYGYKYVSP